MDKKPVFLHLKTRMTPLALYRSYKLDGQLLIPTSPQHLNATCDRALAQQQRGREREIGIEGGKEGVREAKQVV